MFGIVACGESSKFAEDRERAFGALHVSESFKATLATGNEARSDQAFEQYKDAAARASMGLTPTAKATYASMIPDKDLGNWRTRLTSCRQKLC